MSRRKKKFKELESFQPTKKKKRNRIGVIPRFTSSIILQTLETLVISGLPQNHSKNITDKAKPIDKMISEQKNHLGIHRYLLFPLIASNSHLLA